MTDRHDQSRTQSQTDPSTRSDRGGDGERGSPSTVLSTSVRIVGDFLIVGTLVLFLTLLFLETSWPRWAFYGLLVLGVAGYVSVTSPWFDGSAS